MKHQAPSIELSAIGRLGHPDQSRPAAGVRPALLRVLMAGLAAVLMLARDAAHGQSLPVSTLTQIEFEQKLDGQISPALSFRDEEGKEVRLGAYFGKKPLILVLGYYECPMLCTLVLNGMIEGLQEMKWSVGREFDVVCVSINPAETPTLAAAKKRTYLKRYARPEAAAGWHFLTGSKPAIRELSREAGFHFAYEPVSRQYAHPSGLVVLTPGGKISGYLLGVTFPGKALHTAIAQASANKIGSPVQRLILLCFHYNPITGKYGPAIILAVRLLGAATLLGLIGMVLVLSLRSRARIPGAVGAKKATLAEP